MSGHLIRMQDAEGRGPWRPGFSYSWSDPLGKPLPKPITLAVKNFRSFAMKLHGEGFHIGCAVPEGAIRLWFSEAEERRLLAMGFSWVDASGCKVPWRSEEQALIASRLPLSMLPPHQRP